VVALEAGDLVGGGRRAPPENRRRFHQMAS
jgi:hypothetical protein